MNWGDGSLVVFNPLTRRIEDVFDLGPEDLFDGSRGHYAPITPRLLSSDDYVIPSGASCPGRIQNTGYRLFFGHLGMATSSMGGRTGEFR